MSVRFKACRSFHLSVPQFVAVPFNSRPPLSRRDPDIRPGSLSRRPRWRITLEVADFLTWCPRQRSPESARRAASPLAFGLAGLLPYHLLIVRRCRQFRHQALHDDLTGLPNRRCLGRVLARVIADAKRSGKGASLVLIDLDHFRELNDSLGHAEGDAVLREAARRFKSTLRQGDFLARVGGMNSASSFPGRTFKR